MSVTTLEIRPRRQFREFIETDKRWACLVVHRRGGKTYSSLQKLLLRALTHKRPGPPTRYVYIAPTQAQAKDIAWAYLKAFTWQIPGVETNESELKITFPGGMIIRLYSGDNYERMRGLYFDGVVIDEPEDIDPMAWPSVIRPCLSDYRGWAIWIGTIKGKKGQWKRYVEASKDPDWYALLLKASESGIIPPDELADLCKGIAPDIFEQEFECNPNIGRPGAIYAKEVSEAEAGGRVREFEADKGALVHTVWDLGSPENTRVIYFQRVGPFLYIIDHDSGLRLTTAERVAHMMAKGYALGCHCLPHDGAARRPGGLSFVEELSAAGLPNVRVIPRTDDPERRINRMWEMFPNTYFRASTTARLLESLESYRRKEEISSGSIRSEILHDWASHDADAFGYIAEAELAGVITENLPRIGSGNRPGRVTVNLGGVRVVDDFDAEPVKPNFRRIRVVR
ncbi:hypothetical protein HQ447_16325 [bacterium]|nr:hypothetical protein [bacterium]